MDPAFGGSNPPAPATHAGRPRSWLPALRAVVTVGLLAWLLGRADLAAIGAALAGAGRAWVLAALALHFTGLLISAVRWRLLLRAQGAEVPLSYLAQSLLVGTFFNNFLPSTVGGDLVRARDTAAHAGSGTGALAVVLVERASGILVLGFFALGALLWGAAGRGGAGAPVVAATVALLAGFLGGALLLRPRTLAALGRRIEARPASPGGRWSGKARRAAGRLVRTLDALAAAPGTLRATLALAVLLQANVVLHFWCVARSLHLEVGLAALLLIVPIATVSLLLPVSINGIGAREAVFAYLLGGHGVTLAQSLAFSWIAYGTVLAQGLAGGLLYATRRRA